MAKMLSIFLNGKLVVEYDRNQLIPGHQRLYLDRMDEDMNAGISMNDEFIADPDSDARLHYVAMRLVHGILSDNPSLVAATSAYLSHRNARLNEIHAQEDGEQVSVSFIGD